MRKEAVGDQQEFIIFPPTGEDVPKKLMLRFLLIF